MSRNRRFYIEPDYQRRKWQNPEDILAKIGLCRGMTFVDVGCGKGFFSLLAAEIVGETGLVIGIDFDSEWLRDLKVEAKKRRLDNIQTILGRAEETVPFRRGADIIFLGMVLHDFNDPDRVLANAYLMLKKGGILADLDWIKKDTEIGPPVEIRFDEGSASKMMERQGFKIISVTSTGPYHYLILASSR